MHEFASPADNSDLFSFDLSTPHGDQPDVTIVRTEYAAATPSASDAELPIVAGEGRHRKDTLAMTDSPPQKQPVTAQIPHDQTEGTGAESAPVPNDSAEIPPPPTHVDVPENIEQVLETGEGIIRADLPGGDTKKYFLRDRPDLLIRRPSDDPETIAAATETAADMGGHGINVLPSVLMPSGDSCFVVTRWVEGVPLDDALRESPSDALIQTVDATWSGICDYALHCATTGKDYPDDIDRAHQYMVGTMAGDTAERLWLVDLPSSTAPFDRELTGRDRDNYEHQLLFVARGIQEIEALSGTRLVAARAAMERAHSFMRDSEQYGDGLKIAVYRVLDHGEDISEVSTEGSNYIQQLRTR